MWRGGAGRAGLAAHRAPHGGATMGRLLRRAEYRHIRGRFQAPLQTTPDRLFFGCGRPAKGARGGLTAGVAQAVAAEVRIHRYREHMARQAAARNP